MMLTKWIANYAGKTSLPFQGGSVRLKKQYVISRIKRYFDPTEVTNNLRRINLLIIVISDEQKYIYSEESATTRF
uniref:Uncharacterized protein n=1 Tax=Cucumis melo TaxID=3656 RepID=A0A9I9EFS7_CUCME